MSRDWPDKAKALLTELWTEGRTATQCQIALAEIGYDYSRNAVIGKAHRMKLGHSMLHRPRSFREYGNQVMSKSKRKPPTIAAPQTARPDGPPVESNIDGVPVEYLKLQWWQCRAPLDDRGTDGLILSCGRPKGYDNQGRLSSYCPGHLRRFISPAQHRSDHGKGG